MSDNLVKNLREKTEETNLDTILKTTLGGYSRKSVREYVSMMRRQQYDMQLAFSEELQLVQAERDRLARELAEANERTAAAEDTLENAKPLMDRAAGLEKDMDEAIARIQSDAALLDQLREELAQCTDEAQQIRCERDELRTQLENNMAETERLMQELDKRAAQPPVHTGDVLPAEPSMVQDTDAAALVDRPETMQVQLAMLTRERETTEKRMESVIRQEKRLFQALNECREELENRRDQNQCLEAENKALSLRLSEQMYQNISLNREITHIRTMNENLKCKLEAALAQSTSRNTSNGSQDTGDVFLWDFDD
ncbi:MAG: hypothetical protein IKK61_02235 [Clostridia bacterium]|nr:hypothetical protein [Clostridia bacterium]